MKTWRKTRLSFLEHYLTQKHKINVKESEAVKPVDHALNLGEMLQPVISNYYQQALENTFKKQLEEIQENIKSLFTIVETLSEIIEEKKCQ